MIHSPGYVDSNTLAQLGALTQPLKQRSLDLLDIKRGDHVLDVGCGPGIDTITLAHLVGPEGLVVGIDRDEAFIREANERAWHAGLSAWTKHVIADACSIPCATAAFEASRSDRLLQHVPMASVVLGEMVRVTKPGGKVAVTDADWGTLSIDTPERRIERQICNALAGLLSNGFAGREILRLLLEQPITRVTVEVHPIIWRDYATFLRTSLSLPEVDRRLVTSGAVSWDEWSRFLKSLEEAHHRGCFFASGNMVLVTGTRV